MDKTTTTFTSTVGENKSKKKRYEQKDKSKQHSIRNSKMKQKESLEYLKENKISKGR